MVWYECIRRIDQDRLPLRSGSGNLRTGRRNEDQGKIGKLKYIRRPYAYERFRRRRFQRLKCLEIGMRQMVCVAVYEVFVSRYIKRITQQIFCKIVGCILLTGKKKYIIINIQVIYWYASHDNVSMSRFINKKIKWKCLNKCMRIFFYSYPLHHRKNAVCTLRDCICTFVGKLEQ